MTTVLSRSEAASLGLSKPKKSKYGNKRVQIDGIWFDSIKEGNRYRFLKARLDAGEISHLELQPKFKLVSGTTPVRFDSGRQATYKADFAYFDYSLPERQRVIEDVKGMKTDVYKLKKAFVEAQFPGLRIVEV